MSNSGNKLGVEQVCDLFFEYNTKRYFNNNAYARKYNEEYHGGDQNAMRSDHTAFRCNSFQSFRNMVLFLNAIGLEPFETDKNDGLADAIKNLAVSGEEEKIRKANFAYNFDGLGLQSTHFDIKGDVLRKGTRQKIFISMPKISIFPKNIQELIEADGKMFTNKFSARGSELIQKLNSEKSLSDKEAHELIQDFDKNYSVRKIPVLQSSFDSICKASVEAAGKKVNTEILAIGMAFSGVLNHHTKEEKLKDIVVTPVRLQKIGVLPGDPPVQFDGPIVQTNSRGVPQKMELIDDSSSNKKLVGEILNSKLSDDDKRKKLLENNLIITRTVNHEYVEYICRGKLAKVEFDGKEQQLYIWERDGKYFSAMKEHHDKKEYEAKVKEMQQQIRTASGVKDDKKDYSTEIARKVNGFDYYRKEVKFKEWVKNKDGDIVQAPGFTSNNAANIFLATTTNTGTK